ncbi:hypothetical protein B7767_03470, partial [Streptomyces sp. 13-12-16]
MHLGGPPRRRALGFVARHVVAGPAEAVRAAVALMARSVAGMSGFAAAGRLWRTAVTAFQRRATAVPTRVTAAGPA